jgi:multidrug efflux pump subunit AcrA (membrane-fusion protein)
LAEENGHVHVWVVDAERAVRRRVVEVVPSTDDLSRVEKGLKAGESVVLNPPKNLRDGETVKIAE